MRIFINLIHDCLLHYPLLTSPYLPYRLVCGMYVAGVDVAGIAYVVELPDTQIRGALAVLFHLMICGGALSAVLLGNGIAQMPIQ